MKLVKIFSFLIVCVLFFYLSPLFSMQDNGETKIHVYSGKFSDYSYQKRFARFLEKLPADTQSLINEQSSNFFTKSAINNPDTIFEFGLKKNQGKSEVVINLSNFYEEHIKRGRDLETIREKVSVTNTMRIEFDSDQPELPINIVRIDDTPIEKNLPKNDSAPNETTQWLLSNVRAMPNNTLDYIDFQNKADIFSYIRNEIKSFPEDILESNSISDVINAITKTKNLLDYVDIKCHKRSLNVREAIRNEFTEFESIDGTIFYKEINSNVYTSTNKHALRDGCYRNLELLNKKYEKLLKEEAQVTRKRITSEPKILELSKTESEILENSDDSLHSTNQEETRQTPSQQLEVQQTPIKPQGFIKKTVGKILEFCNKPKVKQAVDSAVETGIRNVLLDEQLDYDIQEAVNQIKKIISPPDLSSDFKKKYIDPHMKEFNEQLHLQELREQFSTSLHQDKIDFKKIVESKIILTKSKSKSFYDECNNAYVNRNREPLGYFHNEYSKEVCGLVDYGLDLAKDYSNSNELKMADNITDFSSALLGATRSTAKFFKLAGEGSLQALSKYKNPLNVIKEFGEGFVNLGIGLSKLTFKFAEFNYHCITDPDMAARMLGNFINSTTNKLKEIEKSFSHLSYEEKVVFISRTLTECIVDGAVLGGAFKLGSKTAKFFKALPGLVEKEAGVAKLAGRLLRDKASNFKEAMTPLSNAVMETSEYWQVAGVDGIKVSKASLEIVSNNKGLITSEGGLGKAVSRVIKRTKETKNSNLGAKTGYKFKKNIDIDFRNINKSYKKALNEAFEKTGTSKSSFKVTKWAKNKHGKSIPVEWRAKNGAEVNIDLGHITNGPDLPHIGYQTSGKRGSGGAVRGHILVDDVPANR